MCYTKPRFDASGDIPCACVPVRQSRQPSIHPCKPHTEIIYYT